MQLVNRSPFHAIVQVADVLDEELAAVVIIKSTFDFDEHGQLRPSAEIMPLIPDPLETPFGMLHGELFFKKRGVDLCVLGTVLRSQPVTYARLRLRVGDRWVHELLVIGDRKWVPDPNYGLRATDAQPFTQLPLGYGYAYGGRSEFNGLEAPYPENPVGRGYHIDEAQARGGWLPNIEPGAGPHVQRWDQPGKVVGWGPYPSHWSLRSNPNVIVDESYAVKHIDPGVFNHAHPELVFEDLPTGTPITIEGMQEQPIRLWVPPPPTAVEALIGDERRTIAAPIDGLFIWTDARKLVVTQRARFDYIFRPKQLRQAIVSAN